MPSPTQRTLKLLREEGYTVQVVERWNPFAKRRVDLFNFADILAMKEGEPLIAIQTTTRGNASARRKKMQELKEVGLWNSTGNIAELWTWAKQGKRGERKTWNVKRERV